MSEKKLPFQKKRRDKLNHFNLKNLTQRKQRSEIQDINTKL